jgi:C4-dicarboxylate transporter, DctM subunit
VALIIGLVQKRITVSQFPAMLGTSARVCGVILPIIAVALLFAQALTVVDVPQRFVEFVMGLGTSKNTIILMMLVIWVIAGCFMETSPCIVILAPLMWPLAQKIGMHQVHFCVFMITTLGLGFITPPFGLNLFVMSGLTRTPLTAIARQALPFVFAMILISALIGFVPEISTFSLKK